MNRVFFTEFTGSSEYSSHTFSAVTVECCTQHSTATEARKLTELKAAAKILLKPSVSLLLSDRSKLAQTVI